MSTDEQLNEMYHSVGNTPLLRAEFLDEAYGGRVWIKDESVHPTGTVKDRRTIEVLHALGEYALKTGQSYIVSTITSGNNGKSLEYWTQRVNEAVGFPAVIAVSIVQKGNSLGLGEAENCYVRELDLTKRFYSLRDREVIARQTVSTSTGMEFDNLISLEGSYVLDANGFELDLGNYHSKGFSRMFSEIDDELGKVTIFCPVGNGELYKSLHSMALEGKSGSNVIGATIEGNPYARRTALVISKLEPFLSEEGAIGPYLEVGEIMVKNIPMAEKLKQITENLPVYVPEREEVVRAVEYLFKGWNLGFADASKHMIASSILLDNQRFTRSPMASLADKLVCPDTPWVSDRDIQTLHNLEGYKGFVVSEEDILNEMQEWEKDSRLTFEPSAVVGGAAARGIKTFLEQTPPEIYFVPKKTVLEPIHENIVIINTGKGI